MAGVGTNVVVFLPLAFMGGIVGQFMVQFGMTVVYLTLLSLMFSFTLTPMMIAKFLRLSSSNKKPEQDKRVKNAVKSVAMPNLRKWYDVQFRHPGRVVLAAIGVLIASSMLMKFVGNEFQPSSDANEITITASFNQTNSTGGIGDYAEKLNAAIKTAILKSKFGNNAKFTLSLKSPDKKVIFKTSDIKDNVAIPIFLPLKPMPEILILQYIFI